MPPRPPFFELGTRSFICNSCLSALRKRSPATAWLIRQSSQATHAFAPNRTKPRSPEQEAERLKALKSLGLLQDAPDKLSVNYFEQGEGGALRRIQDQDEFSKALIDPGGELDSRLKEFEDQLQGMTSMAKVIEDMGGKEEADKLRRQFALDSGRIVDDVLEEGDDPSILSSLAIPIFGLNGNRQNRIHRLNNWLRRCCRIRQKYTTLPKDVEGLWKAYSGARTTMSERWHTVPAPTWEMLWHVLSTEYTFSTNRMSYIHVLAKDMQKSGVTLLPKQQILTIEAMFLDGWESEAIENHRRHVSTLGTDPETFLAYWQLGLQMYCRVGDFERAQRVANTILESPYETDPRFVQPLIKLCAETPATVEAGFKLYRDLRVRLGDSMTIQDYDKMISYFLASGNTEFALFIFVDMMKSGSIDLATVERYPPSIANPFFFGKWLKRLIGTGDREGALNVLHFMKSQNITPQAIQVNGLIGAWLRTGAADDVQKAEDIAWEMINTRIQFVERRKRKLSLDGMSLHTADRGWPRANLETFSLLAENYKERNLTAKMGPLWRSFQEAEIAPDSFIFNQLLFSLLQDGKGETLLPLYQEMVRRFKLKPDSHTFMALWQALPVNRLTKILPQDLGAETSRTRALFAEMRKHISIFKTNDGMKMDNFLARNILHSFRKIRDRAGLLLAYRALRRVVNYNPSDMVVCEMLLGTLDLDKLTKRREGYKLIRARASLDDYLVYRQQELAESGEINKDEGMSLELRAEETGNFLELHLEAAFSDMKEEHARQLAIETAIEMGLQTHAAIAQQAKSCPDP
ncbi:hypothetical protein ONZ43_g421 [Nemania bipapillata]|uniref:Uncharacterized protein n=1 Tax=Nemania bipapillata TaxID=110536 RepID=A0ACC2J8B5_9PEZI|nr:hypothetical protein ONZ43_g421 [Nemania bipapillata]